MNDTLENIRPLSQEEINQLTSQGCTASEWSQISVSPSLNLKDIINVRFTGPVVIHEGVVLREIPGGIGGCTLHKNVIIENVASIEFDENSKNGVGTQVAVLDETGSRSVTIYPGLSSQAATLMARVPDWFRDSVKPRLQEFLDSRTPLCEIGEGTIIKNSGKFKNVYIGREVLIEGAGRLVNGSIINNAERGKSITYIGTGVEAENFILEDCRLESKTTLFNSYVGQGVEISHNFSVHDSLFFANCSMANGEAHSILAGPYTVSMHKGTLLIGCQTSFMNAGSLSNQSNHMYKMGPVHWGLLERGVKTSSGSYLMLGAKIGAFSLLMGAHKGHPDSSEFPFSYLFGDERGTTVVVPALMLRSCGLIRDELKWPARDRRLNRGIPLIDHITYAVLNPFTVDTMLKTVKTIDSLLMRPAADDMYMRYKGMKFTRAALERARNLYTLAIFKYLSVTLPECRFPEPADNPPDTWIDLGGQIIPREFLNRILQSDSLLDAENICAEAFERYKELELSWVASRFGNDWRSRENEISEMAQNYDKIIEEDRQEYFDTLERENKMLDL
ncbi:MAG: DUF4954 family protein [Muribaculaceae bacterium]|nr:DUF4954 family protein [Muribaculaceae bacterium]